MDTWGGGASGSGVCGGGGGYGGSVARRWRLRDQ